MTERCYLCKEKPVQSGDLCFQCELQTRISVAHQRERISRRRFTIMCRRTGIQPLPGATWSGDVAQRSLERLRALRRFRDNDLQLFEVLESVR